MNTKYFWYAIAVTAISTLMSWSSLFSSARSGGYRSGGSSYSGGSYGGGGGHK
jgi:uncharacterized membrane protein YgcG